MMRPCVNENKWNSDEACFASEGLFSYSNKLLDSNKNKANEVSMFSEILLGKQTVFTLLIIYPAGILQNTKKEMNYSITGVLE